jgi:hypothetical protein
MKSYPPQNLFSIYVPTVMEEIAFIFSPSNKGLPGEGRREGAESLPRFEKRRKIDCVLVFANTSPSRLLNSILECTVYTMYQMYTVYVIQYKL